MSPDPRSQWAIILACVISVPAPSVLWAQSIKDRKEALRELSLFADDYCKVVNTKGSSSESEINGKLSAEIGLLRRKLLGLGVEADGSIKDSEYNNLLQKDLPNALSENMQCRIYIFKSMADFLLKDISVDRARSPLSSPTASVFISKVGVWVGAVDCVDGKNWSVRLDLSEDRGSVALGRWTWSGSNRGSEGATLTRVESNREKYKLISQRRNVINYDLVLMEKNLMRGNSYGKYNCNIILQR